MSIRLGGGVVRFFARGAAPQQPLAVERRQAGDFASDVEYVAAN